MEPQESDNTSKNSISLLYSLSSLQRRVLPRLLSRNERILLAVFIISFFVSSVYLITSFLNSYSISVPAEGGSLREGIIGIPRFVNPLLANSEADRDLTRLVYTGLLRHSGTGTLIPSLAERYTISDNGLVYTFYLREDTQWSDGIPLTADDIVFTLSLVKDPKYRSVLQANWEGVTAKKIDKRTIVFELAKPYAPFLENTTIGILPQHIWQDILPAEFSLSEKNLYPVGAGPYRVVSFNKNANGRITSYVLEQNPYYKPHPPYIKTIEFVFFASVAELEEAVQKGLVQAASIPITSTITDLTSQYIALPLPRIFGVFFNQNSSQVLADDAVRNALSYAIQRQELIKQVLNNHGIEIYTPLPPQLTGSLDESELVSEILFDNSTSTALLLENGWEDMDGDGVLEKEINEETVRLSFTISTSDAPDLIETARLLQRMWSEIGIEVNLSIFEIGDFEQDVLRPRKYEAVLFGEVFGLEPDPFAFWHSSQRNDPGLNIALYTNPRADALLEEARTQTNQELREKSYQNFQRIILDERPAVFLYSPYYIYQVASHIQGYSITQITLPSDRFGAIHEWYIQTKKKWAR
jgi:peptide/nickel transport system substrate-binding protein